MQRCATFLFAVAISTVVLRAAEKSDKSPMTYLTGPALRERLDLTTNATWTRASLQRILQSITEADRVAIIRDRHIDPTRQIDISFNGETLELGLNRLALKVGGGLSIVENVVYIGPPKVAQRLKTLAALRRAEIQTLPIAERQKLIQSRPWRWKELSTPRELLADLSRESGYEIVGAEQIPHDLWAAGDWPYLTWIDRLTLIAAQFDLTFELDAAGRRVKLIPIPEHVELVRKYPGNGRAAELAKRWASQLPDATVRAEGESVVVTGSAEDHELLERAKPGTTAKRPRVTQQEVYKLSVDKIPLQALLTHLQDRLKIEVRYDAAVLEQAGVKPDQLISIDVKDASLDDLFQAIVGPLGLKHKRNDRVIDIIAGDKP